MYLQVGWPARPLGRILAALLVVLVPFLHGPAPVASAAGVLLTFDPPVLTLARGQAQAVTLRLNATEPVSGIEIHLDFDPGYLRVVNADGHAVSHLGQIEQSPFPFVLANRVDNTTGQIDYAAGRLERRGLTGDVVLVEFRLLALRETEGAPAALRLADGSPASDPERVRATLAAAGGRSIAVSVQPLLVRIDAAVVRGRVGVRGAATGVPAAGTALTVEFSVPSVPPWSGLPPERRNTATQGDGGFTAIAPGAGNYDIAVYSPTSLRSVRRGVMVGVDQPGSPPLCFGELAEGDANRDGQIGPADVAIVVGAFAASAGTEAFTAQADFDRDGFVGVLDFSLLAFNYGLSGDQLAACGP
jgi:hypothetical protein